MTRAYAPDSCARSGALLFSPGGDPLSFTLHAARRAAGATALTLASCALALPLAAPARAVGPVERAWTVADSDGDYSYGLWYTDQPGGTPTKVDESLSSDISLLSASGDGSRIIYVKDAGITEQVVVRDTTGRLVRVLTSFSMSSGFADQPRLSRDGNTAIWTQYSASGVTVMKVPVASGSPTPLASGSFGLAFLDNATVLTQSVTNGTFAARPLAGGSGSVTGLPDTADQVEVSPNSDKIAWYEDTTPDNSDVSTGAIHAATLANSSGAWTVSGAGVLSSTLDNEEPAFSRDGANVYWTQWDGDAGLGDVLVRPADGTAPATTLTSDNDEFDVAITSLPSNDTTAPAAAGDTPYTLNGTTPTIRWSLPDDSTLSGVLVTRYPHGSTTPERNRTFAPGSSFVDSGLVSGHTYDYKLETIDRSGNIGPATTRSLTAIKAGAVFGIPTSTSSTTLAFPVTFAGGALSTTKFWVDYLPAGWTSWQVWVNGATGVKRTFGVAGTTDVFGTTATQGATYAIRVTARDAYGNQSLRTNSVDKAVVPYDQTKAILSGGTKVTSSTAYLGSFQRFSKTTEYAKITMTGNRLQIVGLKCTTCGVFSLYAFNNADKSGTYYNIDTKASSTLVRQVLFTRYFAGNDSWTFTIKPKATAGRPYVLLDGFAMRR